MKNLRTRKIYFIIIMLCSLVTISNYYISNLSINGSFSFIDENAPGLDFFQSMAMCNDHMQWDDGRSFPYPPLMALYYQFMSFTCNLTTPFIKKLQFNDAFDAYAHMCGPARGINFFLTIIIVALYIIIIIEYITRNKYKISTFGKYLLTLTVLISDGFFHVLKTSNSIRAAILCILFFALFHNDKNDKLKNISIIMLSLGINIKPYLAIFLLILIVEKNTKQLLQAVILSSLLLLVPLLFLDGGVINNMTKFIIQLFSYSTDNPSCLIGIRSLVYCINHLMSKLLNIEINLGIVIYPLFILLIIGLVIKLFYINKNWKKYMIMTIFVLTIPCTYKYVLGYIIVNVLLFLLEEEKLTKNNILYLLIFLFIMAPFNHTKFILYAGQIQCSNILLILMGIFLIFDKDAGVSKINIRHSLLTSVYLNQELLK